MQCKWVEPYSGARMHECSVCKKQLEWTLIDDPFWDDGCEGEASDRQATPPHVGGRTG